MKLSMKAPLALLMLFTLDSCSRNTGHVEFVRNNDTDCTLLVDQTNLNDQVNAFLKEKRPELWSDAEFNWEILGPLKCKNGISYFGRSRPRHVGMHFIVEIQDGTMEYLPGL